MAHNRITPEVLRSLVEAAQLAARHAYAPYSNFRVGAAILTKGGGIIAGCNVENASFGLTLCAERVAATKAISDGYDDWHAIAVVSSTGVSPCGACRQFLSEFAPELVVAMASFESVGTYHQTSLQELLPMAMKLDKIK